MSHWIIMYHIKIFADVLLVTKAMLLYTWGGLQLNLSELQLCSAESDLTLGKNVGTVLVQCSAVSQAISWTET